MAFDSLPSKIQNYVNTHFPDNEVLQVMEDKEGFSKKYDLTLSGAISLEFDKDNNISQIDGLTKLPDSVIPAKIRSFVLENHPSNLIIAWELDDKNQQVKLDNRLDLEFNMKGDFLRIDD